jgi:hypothetical protein
MIDKKLRRQKKLYRGFFNRYQWSKPYYKYFLEDIWSLFRLCVLFLRGKGRVKTIYVYPHLPSKRSTISRIARHLNYNLTNRDSRWLLGNPDVAVYWEYQTFRTEFEPLERLATFNGTKVINLHSRDISKNYVDQKFAEIFSYSTFVDPLIHEGLLVEKGDINALHDGRVITGPITEKNPEKVYQIVIDNRVDGDWVKDIRIPIYGTHIPFVYLKYRKISERFKNTTEKTEMKDVEEVLSSDEIDMVKRFCQNIRLEHGELDVLRDNTSGRLYVVDVNNTPQSPPANCSKEIHNRSISLMSKAFEKTFLNA